MEKTTHTQNKNKQKTKPKQQQSPNSIIDEVSGVATAVKKPLYTNKISLHEAQPISDNSEEIQKRSAYS